MDVAEITALLRPQLARALIAVDFDGTLAPIIGDPEQSRPLPGVIDALIALTDRGARVAVITGRPAESAVRLGGLDAVPGIVVAGLYGAQTWVGGTLTSPEPPPEVAALRERLPATLEGADPGLWIEDKGLSLVVHARKARDPQTALDGVRTRVAALADELGFEVHAGRGVLELALPGSDKGAALQRLVDELNPVAVLFAGDDLGDLPAFAQIRSLRASGRSAWAVGADSVEVTELAEAVDLVVDGPRGVLALLRSLGD